MRRSKRTDPYTNDKFRIEIDGIVKAGFTEATIPSSPSSPVERRGGDGAVIRTRKTCSSAKLGNLTLKGITDSTELSNWRMKILQGKIKDALKNMSLISIDEEEKEVARWNFTGAWPSKYDALDINANGNDIPIEILEIEFELIQRVTHVEHKFTLPKGLLDENGILYKEKV